MKLLHVFLLVAVVAATMSLGIMAEDSKGEIVEVPLWIIFQPGQNEHGKYINAKVMLPEALKIIDEKEKSAEIANAMKYMLTRISGRGGKLRRLTA